MFDQRGSRETGTTFRQDAETWNDFETAVVRTDDVMAGDTVKVLPGETIPVDGEVVAGRSAWTSPSDGRVGAGQGARV